MSDAPDRRFKGSFAMPRVDIPPAPESDNRFTPGIKTVDQVAKEIRVAAEADVIVVGGGPGGCAAAIAAARAGARTVLLERYGHLGGMATGGLVNIIPNLSDIYGKRYIGGFCQEFIDRMMAQKAGMCPDESSWGTTDPQIIKYYADSVSGHFFIRKNEAGQDVLLYTAIIDPEIGKNELNRMMVEAGVKLYLHSWVSDVIMDGNTVKGILFESKSGRQAVLGKVIIDSTGDGDLIPWSGAESEDNISPNLRIKHLCFAYWVGGVNYRDYDQFVGTHPNQYRALLGQLMMQGLSMPFMRGMLPGRQDVAWTHPHVFAESQTDVEEMTRMEIFSRENAVRSWQFWKANFPGFENSYIQITCPQLGTTGGRRLVGEYSLVEEDLRRTEPFEDTIAIFPNNDRALESLDFSKVYVPYRALVPKQIEGLLVACRAFSSDDIANDAFNLIPHCMCFGQAAGNAAAIAVQKGLRVRDVPYAELKAKLLDGGAILPE